MVSPFLSWLNFSNFIYQNFLLPFSFISPYTFFFTLSLAMFQVNEPEFRAKITLESSRNRAPVTHRNHLDFIAGWGAGCIETCILYPSNKIIFRQQLHGFHVKDAIKQIKLEGAGKLYRGLMPPLIMRTTSRALMYGLYDEFQVGVIYKKWTITWNIIEFTYRSLWIALMLRPTLHFLSVTPKPLFYVSFPLYFQQNSECCSRNVRSDVVSAGTGPGPITDDQISR